MRNKITPPAWQDPLLTEVQALRAELVAVRVRVAALERRQGPRDEADRALVRALADITQGHPFSSNELVAHAGIDATFASRLADADCPSARELGHVLRRLEGVVIDGLVVQRIGRDQDGIRWRLQVSSL